MGYKIRETVPCGFCKCGGIIRDDKCSNWAGIRIDGNPSKEAKKVLRICKRWLKDNARSVHGALFDFTDNTRVYFFPLPSVPGLDINLDESLCDLELMVAHDRNIKIEFEAMSALSDRMDEVRDYADFAISEW